MFLFSRSQDGKSYFAFVKVFIKNFPINNPRAFIVRYVLCENYMHTDKDFFERKSERSRFIKSVIARLETLKTCL